MSCWKVREMISFSQNLICLSIYLSIYLFIFSIYFFNICTFVMKDFFDFDLCINAYSREQIFRHVKMRETREKQQKQLSHSRTRFIFYFFFFFFYFFSSSFSIGDWDFLLEKWMFQSINNLLLSTKSNNTFAIWTTLTTRLIYRFQFVVSFSMYSHWMKNWKIIQNDWLNKFKSTLDTRKLHD